MGRNWSSSAVFLFLGFVFFCLLVFGYDFVLFLVLLLAVFQLVQIVFEVHFLGRAVADFGLPLRQHLHEEVSGV